MHTTGKLIFGDRLLVHGAWQLWHYKWDQILCHSQPNITIPWLSLGCSGVHINSFRPPRASSDIFFFSLKFTSHWEHWWKELLACSFCTVKPGLWTGRNHMDSDNTKPPLQIPRDVGNCHRSHFLLVAE